MRVLLRHTRHCLVTSKACTDVIVTAIKGKGDFSVYDSLQPMTQAKESRD